MPEIKCPNCGEIIKLDKSSYDALLNNIEKEEIEKQVNDRIQYVKAKYEADLAVIEGRAKASNDKEVADLNNKINELKLQLEAAINDKKLIAEQNAKKALEDMALKEKEIIELKAKLNEVDKDIQLAVEANTRKSLEQLNKKDQEIAKLAGDLEKQKAEADLAAKNLKENYDVQLKLKDEEIERYKDFRLGNSTKDIGESLEQYCHDAFDEIRATAYPQAYFEKDNDASDGTKGDFIFRDYQDDIEVVSIMFEMKNQNEETDKKHKNEDFFKKLDSDRTKKNCEYAVLVTTLESDSKLYNNGIVDVSHRYPKMFVVRPQHFLTIIALIRNMALKSFEYKKQVITYQKENIDITNFENAVKAVAEKINDDYDKAGKIYSEVDKMCDDIVKKVNNFRESFKTATGWIEKAQKQLPNLEVRKLTRGNKTMKEKFAELEEKQGE